METLNPDFVVWCCVQAVMAQVGVLLFIVHRRQFDSWAKSDANVAFGTAGFGVVGKSLPGSLAIRAGKGLTGIAEVFGTASFFELAVSATINGFESGNPSQAVLVDLPEQGGDDDVEAMA